MIEIQKGEEKKMFAFDHELTLKLIDIYDSRCPKGVQCIRAGEAIAVIELNYKNIKKDSLSLCIGCENNRNIPSEIKVENQTLILNDVLPFPEYNVQNPIQTAVFSFK